MQAPLKVIGLSKDYDGKNAVKNINFKVNQMIMVLLVQMVVANTTIGMILGLLNQLMEKY